MSVRFEVYNDEEGGFVYPDEPFSHLVEQLHNALDLRDGGHVTEKKYQAILEKLIETQPDFIDAHAHLGYAFFDEGKPKKALDACLRGVAVGDRLIPEGFSGHIHWGDLDNRPFLRSLHGVSIAYLRLRRHKNAVQILERILALNPNDNQGARLLLGTEYLRLGEIKKAREFFISDAEHYPPYYYDLAFSFLLEKDWVQAATALRRGFCSNPYLAEILCGNPNPRPLAIWHGSNLKGPETAIDHLKMCQGLWQRQPVFIAFIHWLFNHSRVMAERAAVLGHLEELNWERDFKKRGKISDQLTSLVKRIDDGLSEDLIVKRADRRGQSIYPWFHSPIRY